ncbi:MAG: zinc ribbon domain-containing protein [Vicinamibacterales bacterium]
MPIFEYTCRSCRHQFETLVRTGQTPSCPKCQSADLERMLSLPAIRSEGTHALALKAAKKRDKKLGHERMIERVEYERSHDD